MKTLITIAALLLTSTSAFACPLFNGEYERTGANSRTTISLNTQVMGDAYSYSLGGGGYYSADGITKRVHEDNVSGSIKVSCDASNVNFEIAIDGGAIYTIRLTAISSTQLEINASANYTELNGVYSRK